MNKFCGKCGTRLDINGMCPFCEKNEENNTNQKNESEAVEAEKSNTFSNQLNETQPKAKNKKGLIIRLALIGSGVVIVGLLVFFAFFFHWFGLGASGTSGSSIVTSQSNCFAETPYGQMSDIWNLSLITEEPKEVSEIEIKDENSKAVSIEPIVSDMAKDGDVFYGHQGNTNNELYKVTLTGETSCKIEALATEDQLNQSVLSYNDNIKFVEDMGNFIVDGDYVYGCVFGVNHFTSHRSLNYRIFRISKSGNSIEIVGDENVRANCFVIRDGWIYYVDNGYVYDEQREMNDAPDKNRRGIFKMKTDGTQKKKLADDPSDISAYTTSYGALTLWDNKLYYLDYTSGESPLYRMNLDGSEKEKLSDKSVSYYTINTADKIIYYLTGNALNGNNNELDFRRNLCKIDLKNNNNNEIVTQETFGSSSWYIDYNKGYIYLYNRSSKSLGNGYKRLEPATGKTYIIEYEEKDKVVAYDDFGFENVVDKGKQTVCWKMEE